MSRISIVIPCFNRADLVGETIVSCLAQTHPPDEIIAVNDGSADETAQVLAEWVRREPRVKTISIVNQGLSITRNVGMALATGDLLYFLDSDDLLMPDALSIMEKTLDDPVLGAVICTEAGLLTETRAECEQGAAEGNRRWGGQVKRFENFLDFVGQQQSSFNSVLIRRTMVVAANGFDPALRNSEDMNLMMRLGAILPATPVAFLEGYAGILKRLSPTSLGQSGGWSHGHFWLLRSLVSALAAIMAHIPRARWDLHRALFDKLYVAATVAFRRGYFGDAYDGWHFWKRGGQPLPALQPAWHGALHRTLGFEGAEKFLARARLGRDLFKAHGPATKGESCL